MATASSPKKIRVTEKSKISTILAAGLQRLNGGKNWVKGKYKDETGEKFCAVGSMRDFPGNYHPAWDMLDRATKEQTKGRYFDVVSYNDAPRRKFAEVKAVFLKAIKLAKAAGN